MVYSDLESLTEALTSGKGAYHSRTRGLWVKGQTSGAEQELLRVDADCDRDALRFLVRQRGSGFCHRGETTCWGPDRGLSALARTLAERTRAAPAGSYTARLLADPELLRAKLVEEAGELASAEVPGNVAWEAADLLYFTLVAMARGGVDLTHVESVLQARSLAVTRRRGDAKADSGGRR